MAMFVHLTSGKRAKSIARSGIRLPRTPYARRRGIWAMPVTRNYYVSHQWLRELKRRGDRTVVAVHFRIDDAELVTVGHYNSPPLAATAAEASAIVGAAEDPAGYEVVIPRAIDADAIHAIRPVSQVIGWRFHPKAHGTRPCPCPVCLPRGEIKSRKLRKRSEA
jgi:hypothetical protein